MAQKEVKFIVSGDGSRAKAAIKDVEGAAGSLRKGVGDLNSTLSTFGAVLGGAGIVAAIQSATAAAVQMERATIGLAVTSRYAGAGMSEASAAAKALAQDGLMSIAEASQGLQNLLMRGFGLQESIDLMERFKDSAAFNRQASREFGEAIVQATEGLKNENSILVDNAGVTKNVSVMWAEYARQIGVGEKSLTQAQKRTAEYNGILRETEGQVGNAALMTDTYQGAQARLNQEIFNAKVAFGQSLAPALTDILKGMTPLIGLTAEFIGGLQIMSVSLANFAAKMGTVMSWEGMAGEESFSDFMTRLKGEWDQFDAYAEQRKTEIASRGIAYEAPNIGRDSGARRKDVVSAPKEGGVVKAAQRGGYNAESVDEAMWIDDRQSRIAAYVELQDLLKTAQQESSLQRREEYFSALEIEKEMEIDSINARVDAYIAGEEAKRQASAATLDGAKKFLGDLSTLQNSHSRKAFELGKAASVANAMVNTYEGVTGAYTFGAKIGGPPLGAVFGAAALAAGLANVQAIASQKFGGGGMSVGGGGGFTGQAATPVVTQPATQAPVTPANTVNVTIVGNVVDHDKFAREVIPSIQKAFADGVA